MVWFLVLSTNKRLGTAKGSIFGERSRARLVQAFRTAKSPSRNEGLFYLEVVMNYCTRRYLGLLVPALLLLMAVEANGQAIQSTILGKVTDPSGAAIANASIIVK